MKLTAEISQVISNSVLRVDYIYKLLLTTWGDVSTVEPGRGGYIGSPELRPSSETEQES